MTGFRSSIQSTAPTSVLGRLFVSLFFLVFLGITLFDYNRRLGPVSEGLRGQFGKMNSRKMKNATYTTTLPGAPDGKYVAVGIMPGGSEPDTEIHAFEMDAGRERVYWIFVAVVLAPARGEIVSGDTVTRVSSSPRRNRRTDRRADLWRAW